MAAETTHTRRPRRLLRIKQRDTQAAQRRSLAYTRIVGTLRWLLPVVVLVGLVGLILWPMWNAKNISTALIEKIPNLMIEKLNLTGFDDKGQPYSLRADRALQAATAKNLIDLEKPNGELTLQDGSWVTGQADKGRIDQNSKKLWLNGKAELFHDKGYRFSSEEINVDLATNVATSEQPVTIQGNFGTIDGSGFLMENSGNKIIIKGPANAKLHLQ